MTEIKRAKVLVAARQEFLRYGYRRVCMGDIAKVAGVSRPALYLVFKSKEEIFAGVLMTLVDETIAEIENGMAERTDPGERLAYAFEVWAVHPFELASGSPEAKELFECSFDFAKEPLRKAYARFESVIAPDLDKLLRKSWQRGDHCARTVAHVLASAIKGFKQTAETAEELRDLIHELLALSFEFHGSP